MRLAALAPIAALCAACAPVGRTPKPVLSVGQIAPDRTPYDGQAVVIKGRVDPRCYPLTCWLESEDGEQHLSIAYRKHIEPEIMRLAGRTILLKARVDATCGSEHKGVLILCTDRAEEIIPIKILQVF